MLHVVCYIAIRVPFFFKNRRDVISIIFILSEIIDVGMFRSKSCTDILTRTFRDGATVLPIEIAFSFFVSGNGVIIVAVARRSYFSAPGKTASSTRGVVVGVM